ncbi:hypothetical protein Pan44_03620 [Caulifigura coniformis]|uniref:Leucine Rich repeats (2 copies) n=1 Tax=Caulifigura coniformis TaxID=2527983 RepID=A0A517S8B0_9PLAN|nr:hypothetical protein [Caulifigura coniformis]QDT52352.1 hypothetical protein Pan44_03620 [Caulifigura coniformis]
MVCKVSKRAAITLSISLGCIGMAGCGADVDGGPGSYAAAEKMSQSAQEFLKSKGATMTRKRYPPGEAWVIDLSGKEVTDETFDRLQELDHVAELNLSKTSLTDAHMKLINNPEVGGVLVSLDVSNTAVTDAGLKELTTPRFLMKIAVAGSKVSEQGLKQWQADRNANSNVPKGFKVVKVMK